MSRLQHNSLPRKMTVNEYLEFERSSPDKHDYVNGDLIDVRAMAGTTGEHSAITANWLIALGARLKDRPCRPFDSNLKVRSAKRTNYRYPDLSVACKPIQYDPREGANLTLLNPTLIVEILSESTEAQDRVEKFAEYREMESFREYVLTAQKSPYVETFFLQDDGQWVMSFTHGLDKVVKLRSLGIEVPLSEIYVGVEFPVEPAVETEAQAST